MIIHIYITGRIDDTESLDIATPRVTFFADGARFNYPSEKVLAVGTMPHVSVLPMSKVDWFWVEEN